jgi:hypothetical protein
MQCGVRSAGSPARPSDAGAWLRAYYEREPGADDEPTWLPIKISGPSLWERIHARR